MKRYLAMILALVMLLAVCAYAEEGQKLSKTTGLPTDKEYKAIAVQFDNTGAARPQLNMSRADVVYEMEIHNGGYTRYTAVFNDTIPEKVEAIRSARIMHVDAALDWSAHFVYYGAQGEEGSRVDDYFKTVKLYGRTNGMYDGNNFYRDKKRKAPYNVVFKAKNLYDTKVNAVDPAEVHTPLEFSADNYTAKGENVNEFSIPYSVNLGFNPSYKYIADQGIYRRYYNGKLMKDGADDATYDVSNVIVMTANYAWNKGKADCPLVELIGSNECEYFIGGKHFTGSWYRNSANESTVYLDDEGKVVQFKPGKTFIQVIKPEVDVKIEG